MQRGFQDFLLAIQSAEAKVIDPQGKSQTVTLAAGGEGFTAQWTPDAPGLYAIDVLVSAVSPDGIPVERTAFLAVEAQPQTKPAAPGKLLAVVGLGAALVIGLGLAVMMGVVILLVVLRRRRA